MFIINYTHQVNAQVIFDSDFRMPLFGSIDDIVECVLTEMHKHKFTHADVCDDETGEILVTVNRSL